MTLRTALAPVPIGPGVNRPFSSAKGGCHPANAPPGQSGARKPQWPSEQQQRKTRPTLPPSEMHHRRRGNDHSKHRLAREHQPNPVFAVAEQGQHPNDRQYDDHLPVSIMDTDRPPRGQNGREGSKCSSSQNQSPAQRQNVLAPQPVITSHHPLVHDRPDAPARAGAGELRDVSSASPQRKFAEAGISGGKRPGHTERSTPPPAPLFARSWARVNRDRGRCLRAGHGLGCG
jgi:hypothetical protein